ncbi:uncharacterized protein [Paramisgurnus dabryanus]|uniref:uncharacterized protein isoform X2 n=1 Tax=Paramisgurnus dabryanus TaxID=90735 RepID=UPI003CCFBE55
MVNVWIILVAASSAVTVSAVTTYQKRLSHGDYLSLDLPERTAKLEFVSADEQQHETIWQSGTFSTGRATRGVVSSVNNGYNFRINHVTFEDQGTYTLRNSFTGITNAISIYVVRVETKRRIIERVPGETLTIPLDGIKMVDANLRFYSNYSTINLVEHGVPVGKENADYIGRLRTYYDSFQVLNVNVSDLGRYELRDQKGRPVSNTTMILVDRHSNFTPNKGLLALLLLGIPGGICFCCRKKVCKCCYKDKSEAASPPAESIPICHPVTDPAQGNVAGNPTNPGQSPNYYPPPNQGPNQYPPPNQGQNQYPAQPQWNGQPGVPPNPGFSAEYPPQNPLYPPVPGVSPAQPPQWSGPPNQYNAPATVNYNPMVNSAPPGATSPLLNAQPEPAGLRANMDILNSSGSADVQFSIDNARSPTNNFL